MLEKKEKPKKGAGFARFVLPFRLNTTSGGGQLILINPEVAPTKTTGHRYTLRLDRNAALDEKVTVVDAFDVADQGR